MEVDRAKALADIAKIVSFVKISEALKIQKGNKHLSNGVNTQNHYPK
jgi:hypothetical protein